MYSLNDMEVETNGLTKGTEMTTMNGQSESSSSTTKKCVAEKKRIK